MSAVEMVALKELEKVASTAASKENVRVAVKDFLKVVLSVVLMVPVMVDLWVYNLDKTMDVTKVEMLVSNMDSL